MFLALLWSLFVLQVRSSNKTDSVTSSEEKMATVVVGRESLWDSAEREPS